MLLLCEFLRDIVHCRPQTATFGLAQVFRGPEGGRSHLQGHWTCEAAKKIVEELETLRYMKDRRLMGPNFDARRLLSARHRNRCNKMPSASKDLSWSVSLPSVYYVDAIAAVVTHP
jgi:hypothetical protein